MFLRAGRSLSSWGARFLHLRVGMLALSVIIVLCYEGISPWIIMFIIW